MFLVQHYGNFTDDCASKRKGAAKGNSARPEKARGLKRLQLAQIDIYPAISGAVLPL